MISKSKAPPKKEKESEKPKLDANGKRIPMIALPKHSCGEPLTPTKLKHGSVIYECKKCEEIVELEVTGESN
jgi:hypothetical protein